MFWQDKGQLLQNNHSGCMRLYAYMMLKRSSCSYMCGKTASDVCTKKSMPAGQFHVPVSIDFSFVSFYFASRFKKVCRISSPSSFS